MDNYTQNWTDAVFSAYADMKLSSSSKHFLDNVFHQLCVFREAIHSKLSTLLDLERRAIRSSVDSVIESCKSSIPLPDTLFTELSSICHSSITMMSQLQAAIDDSADLLFASDIDISGFVPALREAKKTVNTLQTSLRSSLPSMKDHQNAMSSLSNTVASICTTLSELESIASPLSTALKDDITMSLMLSNND
ncbi:hypothetical protein P9112_012430 [Eukaryota sp. TZLM1-RC]